MDTILNVLSEFVEKSRKLFIHFLHLYRKPILELVSIDKNRDTISYKNRSNKIILSKHIKEFFNNSYLISKFNSYDAAQLGYLYGIWLRSSDK